MAMTIDYVTTEMTLDEASKYFGDDVSMYSKLNLANLRNNKAQNDLDEKPTRGYGHHFTGDWDSEGRLIYENLDHEARVNTPENLCIAVGEEIGTHVIGYYSAKAMEVELAKPNWQSDEP